MLPAAAMNIESSSALQQIVEVPETCLVQPPPAPAAPSPARPCSDESAAGFPAPETELPTLSGHLQYSLEANMTLHYKLQNKWYFKLHVVLSCCVLLPHLLLGPFCYTIPRLVV